ncbi:MAG: hypothetical protein ACP5F3_03270 [Candidatus Syntrophosphaera sp.]
MNLTGDNSTGKPILRVISKPEGAQIFRNGRFTGKITPAEFEEAEFLPGDYSVQLPGFVFRPPVETVDSLSGEKEIRFLGTAVEPVLNVTSNPPGASIFRNGSFTGHLTPHGFRGAEFLPGAYAVQLASYKFYPQEIEVDELIGDTTINFKGDQPD